MYYIPDRHYIYCHHCSEGYDAVWFTAKSKRCGLDEAAWWLERKYHILSIYEDDMELIPEMSLFEKVADYYAKTAGEKQDMGLDNRLKVRAWFWKMSKSRQIDRLLKSMDLEIEDFEEEDTDAD